MWNLLSVHLVTVLVSMQDRCMVCAKRTTGLEIILDAPDGTPRYEAQVDARFGPFGDCANLTQDWCSVCIECTIGLEIVLDAPDGTNR
jgi:hypothetical protein